MAYRIHRIEPDDWQRFRDVRLRMLADSPAAYEETYADALAQPNSEWQFRAKRAASPGNVGTVVIHRDGEWIGTMSGFLPEPDTAKLVSVWVHPEHRGQARGVADLLLDDVLSWARESTSARRLTLEVHESNARAIAYYRRRGFADTGNTCPYPLDPTTLEVEMVLAL